MSTPAPTPALHGRSLLGGFTRLSKGLSVVLVAGYLLSLLLPSTREYFALLPGRTIPFAWNLVTAGFLETNAVQLVVDVVALLVLGRLVEPIWGSKEFLRFIVVTATTTSACTFVLMIVAFYATQQGRLLYVPISGFHGVAAGMLVAVKQLMPDSELPLGPLKLRAKWLPSILVLGTLVVVGSTGQGVLQAPFVLFGTYCAWLYLRFYQSKGEGAAGALRGDPSDDFSFASFFPEPARPVVNTLATVFGRIFCGRRQERRAADVDDGMPAGMPLPGSDPIEATRRRERGARALEERLSKAEQSKAAGQPAAQADAAADPAASAASGDSQTTVAGDGAADKV